MGEAVVVEGRRQEKRVSGKIIERKCMNVMYARGRILKVFMDDIREMF